jgi:hypothetical protein
MNKYYHTLAFILNLLKWYSHIFLI